MNFFPLEAFCFKSGGKLTKRVLVTGGAGFLGRHVMLEVASAGDIPAAFDNLDPRCGGSANFPRVVGDVTDYAALEKLVCEKGFSHILHLAAYGRNLTCRDFPHDAWRVNVWGTRVVLRLAKMHPDVVKRVVVCSSNIVLSPEPTDYKFTKRFCEHEVSFYAAEGVSCMGLRPSNIYGAGQSRTEHQLCAFAGLDESYARHKRFDISGDGTQTRDWIHAEDVARAFVLAMNSDFAGQTVDICTGRQTSMNEIARILGVPVSYTEKRPGDAQALISDEGPARRLLDFHAGIVLEDRIWDAFPSVPRRAAA